MPALYCSEMICFLRFNFICLTLLSVNEVDHYSYPHPRSIVANWCHTPIVRVNGALWKCFIDVERALIVCAARCKHCLPSVTLTDALPTSVYTQFIVTP